MASPHCPSPLASPPDFSTFRPASESESEISKILLSCPNKQCDSDPIPTCLLKQCSSVLIPTITNIVNLSLSSGHFHPILKQSIIFPLLKKFTLDKEQLSNYRPISNLSLISKIIEHIVKSRLTDYLSLNNLLNPHQSAYCKHHSTETALSYIHDHLINAIGSQKLSCLCLLDLSAAFDTIDHNILITRFHLGLGFMAPFSTGLNLICHLGLSLLDMINASLPPIPVYVVFPKVLFLVPYFSIYYMYL